MTNEPNWCDLCGGTLQPHDDTACDEKMANWRPTGLLPSLDTPPPVQVLADTHPDEL